MTAARDYCDVHVRRLLQLLVIRELAAAAMIKQRSQVK